MAKSITVIANRIEANADSIVVVYLSPVVMAKAKATMLKRTTSVQSTTGVVALSIAYKIKGIGEKLPGIITMLNATMRMAD